MRLLVTVACLLTLFSVNALAGHSLAGKWAGEITIMGQKLGVITHFEETADSLSATIDIPMQNAKGVSLQKVSFDDPDVYFEIPGMAVAAFDGKLEGDVISGAFMQSGMKGSFQLERVNAAAAQAKQENLPYDELDVKFANGEYSFAGTLTLPRDAGPHPAAVLITGSGPQNRDQEVFGFKVFRVLADQLTRAGIAVLRYDDRGVGGSTGSVAEATTRDFAGDVVAAARFLKQRADISGVGAIGHSEGGIVAPLAAQSGELDWVVLLAGTAVTGEEILYAQGELILKANGASEAQRQASKATQAKIFAAMRSGQGWDEVRQLISDQVQGGLDGMTPEQLKAIPDQETFISSQVDAQITRVQSPWYRHFVDYDPSPALESLDIPVLAVFGGLDLQVPAETNARGMERAFKASGHKNYRIETLPDANHLFQKANTGSPSEYGELDKTFVPELMPLINAWLKAL